VATLDDGLNFTGKNTDTVKKQKQLVFSQLIFLRNCWGITAFA